MQLVVTHMHQYNLATLCRGETHSLNPILVLDIRRSHIVEDTLSQILSLSPIELKKPLKVHFLIIFLC